MESEYLGEIVGIAKEERLLDPRIVDQIKELIAKHRVENFHIQNSDVAQRLSAFEELKASKELLLQPLSVRVF